MPTLLTDSDFYSDLSADVVDDRDYSNKYNTALSDDEEVAYQRWAKANGREKDVYDYDLRGAWKELQSGDMKESDNGHLGDKYKKPNHPTFSNQSMYSTEGNEGGKWGVTDDGKTYFEPSVTNLRNMSEKELRAYFKDVEPDVELRIRPEYKLFGVV